jgi:hypothetical protein
MWFLKIKVYFTVDGHGREIATGKYSPNGAEMQIGKSEYGKQSGDLQPTLCFLELQMNSSIFAVLPPRCPDLPGLFYLPYRKWLNYGKVAVTFKNGSSIP